MSRGQIVVLLAFLAIVGCLAALVLPALLDRPARPPVDAGRLPPRARPLPPAPGGPTPEAGAPRVEPPGTSPSAPPPASNLPRRDVAIRVTRAGGAAPAPGTLRFVGAVVRERGPDDPTDAVPVRRTARAAWVGAPGMRWAEIPAVHDDAPATVALEAAAPSLRVEVREADGSPAADVPVAWPGPDGRPRDHRTDAAGVVLVDDRGAGLLRIKVGSTERAGPTLVRRVGIDREAAATLDRPLTVVGRVLDAAGAPAVGIEVRGTCPEGACGSPTRTGADGVFRWVGRMTDHLALGAGATRGEAVHVEPPWPDPRGTLDSRAEARLVTSSRPFAPRLDLSRLGRGGLARVVAEPAALALVREAFGREEVAFDATSASLLGDEPIVAYGLDVDLPWRVSVRGDVVPEDHLLSPADPERFGLRLVPEPALPEAADSGVDPGAAYVGRLHGHVTDRDGHGLAGLTVSAGGRRTTTAKDGAFELTKLPVGERLSVLYAWLEGADTGGTDPAPFAPWFEAVATPSEEPLELVLPRAARVTFRATDGLAAKPLSWVRVVVLDGEGAPRFDDVVATEAGRVTLEGLVPGTAGTIAVFAPGLRREVALVLKAGETVDLGEVALVRGGRIEGFVKTLAGRPIPGATVAAMDDGRGEGGGHALVRDRDLFLRRTTTDANGAFALEGLDPSRPAALAIQAPGFAPSARRVLWGDDGKGKLSASLGAGGTVRLRLTDGSGKPVTGALVDLRDARTGARRLDLVRRAGWGSWVASSEDLHRATEALLIEDDTKPGTYRLGPAEPGPYDVFVEHPGFRPVKTQYTIVDASPDSPDNPMRLPLEALEWRLELEPLPPPAR